MMYVYICYNTGKSSLSDIYAHAWDKCIYKPIATKGKHLSELLMYQSHVSITVKYNINIVTTLYTHQWFILWRKFLS